MFIPKVHTQQGHNMLLRTLASRTHAEAVEIGKSAADFMERSMDEMAQERNELLTALKAALNHCDRETTHMIEAAVRKFEPQVPRKPAA